MRRVWSWTTTRVLWISSAVKEEAESVRWFSVVLEALRLRIMIDDVSFWRVKASARSISTPLSGLLPTRRPERNLGGWKGDGSTPPACHLNTATCLTGGELQRAISSTAATGAPRVRRRHNQWSIGQLATLNPAQCDWQCQPRFSSRKCDTSK